MQHVIVAHHPVCETPYNKLIYVGANAHGTPLYQVMGTSRTPCSAPVALRAAFVRYGGQCYYCKQRLKPQARPSPVSLDHVVAKAVGGTNLLHNFVIACKDCNKEKGLQPMGEFKPEAGIAYLAALERHIADSVRSVADPNILPTASPSSRLPPKPA
jgi:5-methylcytosine-specific restriction endonuclease McrA